MILISASDLGRQYSGEPIFQGLKFELRAGERVGLVGPNGAGKTTLMRILSREDRPDYGSLHVRSGIRVSLLRQHPEFEERETLMTVARSGLAPLVELQHELEEAALEMAEAEDDRERETASRRYADVQDRLEHQDAYTIDHRVEEVLGGLGFTTDQFHQSARSFSGGQQSRMMLAKLLLESPDVMLLDEPSNHLDIETTEWLESYLSRQPVAMIVVSHDRYFLDAVVTKIWELHFGSIDAYPGNYSQYWKLRQERAEVLRRQSERQAEQRADLQDFIRKWGVGQKAKQAKDREKKLARLDAEQVETMVDIEGPVMGFDEVDRSGDIAIEAERSAKSYNKPLFRDVNLGVERGQCVGIMGPNGSGKTTLLKVLIGREKPDSGEVKLGHKVSIGYYDQGLESLPTDTTVLRAVWPEDEIDWVQQDVRDLLARFGLKGDIVFQTVGQLSGGERSKAALARLAATGANLLIMDEPTNHLDIWSCEALERSIKEFEGTILVVSHDRYFLNQVADRLVVIADGRARVIEGDYETYQRLCRSESEASSPGGSKPTASSSKAGPRGTGGVVSPKPEKRKRKYPYRKPDSIEREIAEVEADLAEVELALGNPDTYRDADTARDVQERFDDLQDRLSTLYEHWEEALELNT